MRRWKLRFSVRTLLLASAIVGISMAWLVSTRNVRVAQSETADFLHENSVYLLERDLNFKRHSFLVGDGLDDLVGNKLPIRNPAAVRNHWTAIVSKGYDHAYITNKTTLSIDDLAECLQKLPWLKSASIHEDLYSGVEVNRLEERFPNVAFDICILIAE